MNLDLAKDPLEIRQGKTLEREIVHEGPSLEDIFRANLTGDAGVIAWEMHRIIAGRYEKGAIRLADESPLSTELLIELRAFNEKEELHLVRDGEKISGRYLRDGEGNDREYVDSLARLWGEREKTVDGFVTLHDTDRKLRLTVPCRESGKYLGLVTRNYIGYAESGQAGYVDFRFVKIVSAEEARNEGQH